ncbi:hypothetical protein ASPWEDRAFT_173437 [Aspergillus wentii DTO 134E9]|uniref:PWI domain-containing protein n=1 Tax=Aspergillus wentii DTO 134E9 TaxID=1073089 RepID=A0A1L9RGH4_ASPWE|nr:uncharacterized protein ASPWEDRAFT_173437 [Aspergillus wentii DTO 134E9]OJJ34004.1 hypothetical protein ASPWEDRAFT_173437 [Aspergillus wentii DTO 134E9]
MAASVDAKLLRQTKFPPEFSRKVDMTKVNIEVMKKWIAGKISEILGNEDDVVIELCFNLLEGSRYPDIKSLQIQLTGFLDRDTAKFCKELWSLCLSGQENPQGVPKELLEAKKLELIQEKIEAEKAAEEARRQKEQEQTRERDLERLRQRERSDRARGGRRGGGRGDDAAAIVFASLPRDGSSIHMSPQALVEDADPPGHRVALPLDLCPHPGHHLVNKTKVEIGETDAVARSAARFPRIEGTAGDREDAVQTMVIELDPSPAVIHPAHVLPEETEGDRDRCRPAVHPDLLYAEIDAGEETLPFRGQDLHLTALVLGLEGQARKSRDDRRLSRSRERDNDRRRRHSTRSVSRSRSRSRGRTRSASNSPRRYDSRSRSRSDSRSRSPRREKRRRSLQRYAPAGRRRRNTSSVSVPTEKRQKMTDDEDTAKRSPPPAENPNSTDQEMKDADEKISSRSRTTRISSTELREKLLREKLVAKRRTASDKVGDNSKGQE